VYNLALDELGALVRAGEADPSLWLVNSALGKGKADEQEKQQRGGT
jgi:hypothetical protein